MKKLSLISLLLVWVHQGFSQTIALPALQTVNYKYHIRGGLLGINLDGTNAPVPNYTQGDLFSYKLEYETAGQWAGNIGKQTWARASDLALPCNSDTRSYTFGYDDADRLTSAAYTGVGNYSIPNISYDKNSNITGLQRNGWLGSSYGLMDNLSYGYLGNRLTSVTDGVGGNHTVDLVPKLNGIRTFYEDGSLKSDENKEITLIEYDPSLMLPTKITLTGGRTITMGYALDGTLETRQYSTGESWVYSNGITFLNDQPYTMPIPEGRAIYSAGAWKNEFFITDHLGNVRVTFAEESGKLNEKAINDLDPTGVEHANTSPSVGGFRLDPFKFQDKESLSNTFGLSGLHDFGPRFLDKTIGGIWSQPDILAENYAYISPYNYVFSNPLSFIDPSGMSAVGDVEIGYGTTSAKNITGSIDFAFFGSSGGPTTDPAKTIKIIQDPGAMASIPQNNKNYYGNNFRARFTNSQFWMDLLNSEGAFKPNPNTVHSVMPEIATYFSPGGAVKGISTGYKTFNAFKKANGVAGKGMAWHHIVEKHASNVAKFGSEQLHNAKNLIKLPEGAGSIHRKITGFYNSKRQFTGGKTVRNFISQKSYTEQFEFGMNTLKQIINNKPLPK